MAIKSEIDPDLQMILADMRQDFIEDTGDKLEEIEQVAVRLRQGIGQLDNNVMEIKRLMHTIKGGGGSFGFPTVSKIAHAFEDYLVTTGDIHNVHPEDILLFCDAIASILEARDDPDDLHANMMLRSLPTGRGQGGRHTLDRGLAMLIMPRGVQRKIIAQELAQFGYKVNILDDPIRAIEMAITLKPDFIIATLLLERMTGLEFACILRMISTTQNINCAVVTADDLTDDLLESLPPKTTVIKKGPLFAPQLMKFIRS
jgi:CheY-like chemotaxis protein/HPt (histidine-containing phosphotransfer) domain-containing protein